MKQRWPPPSSPATSPAPPSTSSSTEPATENVLFGLDNVICTPHLGAATTEAQENVALQVAEQMSDYLLTGAITNAINFPSITADEAPRLKPYLKLAEQLGSFAGQLTESGLTTIRLEYAGDMAEMNVKALTSAALAGLFAPDAFRIRQHGLRPERSRANAASRSRKSAAARKAPTRPTCA